MLSTSILPPKTWKHGLSGGLQRLFKVDHPKDGHTQHTQEGFGLRCSDSDKLHVENYLHEEGHLTRSDNRATASASHSQCPGPLHSSPASASETSTVEAHSETPRKMQPTTLTSHRTPQTWRRQQLEVQPLMATDPTRSSEPQAHWQTLLHRAGAAEERRQVTRS
jgi:hypothetical protein